MSEVQAKCPTHSNHADYPLVPSHAETISDKVVPKIDQQPSRSLATASSQSDTLDSQLSWNIESAESSHR